MNIILATYNYFPYALGGSEIYVSGLANYLTSQNHKVKIFAAVPPKADGDTIYSGVRFDLVRYDHSNIEIYGIILKNETTDEIYGKYSGELLDEWKKFFSKISWVSEVDYFHFHGYTGAINLTISDALKHYNSKVKLFFSYHTPISCPKGTLLYFDKSECKIKPNISTCTACMIHHHSNLSERTSKWISILLPVLPSIKLPNKIRIKYLVKKEIESFQSLTKIVNHWFAFSNGIEENLIKNGVSAKNLTILRHGISNNYFNDVLVKKNTDYTQFVFIGRMVKIKGILTLLNAWKMLEEESTRRLIVIGDHKSDSKEIDQLINDMSKRTDVRFVGKKSQSEIKEILLESHCIIIPSEWVEIGPLVFHEGIVSGCNIIASDLGGNKELADYYKTGCTTFLTFSPDDLKNKIQNFSFTLIHHRVMSADDHYQKISLFYE